MELSIKIVQCYEANYPENMHQLFVVNGKYNNSLIRDRSHIT